MAFLSKFPNCACLLCNQFSHPLVCEYCKNDTQFFSSWEYPANLLLRPDIAKGVRHSSFAGLRACGFFNWPFDTLIHQLKFTRNAAAASVLANWFVANCLDSTTPLPDCLLPVPIHFNRYFKRRYNQSAELAKQIAKHCDVPVNFQWAQRVSGKTQHRLDRAQRLLNLRQAFNVLPLQNYRRVAIIDDVVTTGCTVDVLSRQIKQQLPDVQIEIWAMAITPSPRQKYLAV